MGDELTTLPSNEKAKVKSIYVGDKDSKEAKKGQPVTIQLDREVDVSRGCVLTVDSGVKTASTLTATICGWMMTNCSVAKTSSLNSERKQFLVL